MFIFERNQSFPEYYCSYEALQNCNKEENNIITNYQSAIGPNFDNFLYDQKESVKKPLCQIKCYELEMLEQSTLSYKQNKESLKMFNFFFNKLQEIKLHKDSYDAAIFEEEITCKKYRQAKDYAENVH